MLGSKVMSDQTDNLHQTLQRYGLTANEAEIYSYILVNGYSSALTISRDLRMGRTKVYRVLDKLLARELAQQKLDDMGMKFGAADASKLEQLVVEKEQSIIQMRKTLPDLISQMRSLTKTSEDASKILYYKGIEGYKQVTYNSTKARGILRIIERVNDMSVILPRSFAESVRQKFVENKIHSRQISPTPTLSPWTDVAEFVRKFSEARYLPPEKLQADFEVLIYNDVYAIYNTEGKNTFCIEIYNPELAKMQKQIFDFLWESAQVMEFTDEHGTARLAKKV
jgi:sugar-specific transcriptional regulator TrmB